MVDQKKQGHRGHGKVKFEISQALINMYVKFYVHPTYVKQVILLKMANRRADAPHDDNSANALSDQIILKCDQTKSDGANRA